MLHDIYQENVRQRNRINPVIKILLILCILFFLYRMYPVAKAWGFVLTGN